MTSADMTSFMDSGNVQVIEWNMLDKSKFIPLSILSTLTVRGLVYPLTVIKTRIQVQSKSGHYRGTVQTFRHIYHKEGISGLYRGYVVNAFQVFSSFVYVSTYENVRQILLSDFDIKNNTIRALVGGGCASAASQLILVPFDVISQHMMVFERIKPTKNVDGSSSRFRSRTVSTVVVASDFDTLNLAKKLEQNPRLMLAPLVCREIYRRDGLIKGFYRGYMASLMCYAPSSGLFWACYHLFTERIFDLTSKDFPHLAVQAMAAPVSGAAVAILTNPLDLFRSNLQVRSDSWSGTIRRLQKDEGWAIFTKGLSTRIVMLPLSSFLFMVGYELIKRLSVHSDLKHQIQW